MKILIVASFNKGFYAPFILEQSAALEQLGHTVHYFGIQGHGICTLKKRNMYVLYLYMYAFLVFTWSFMRIR